MWISIEWISLLITDIILNFVYVCMSHTFIKFMFHTHIHREVLFRSGLFLAGSYARCCMEAPILLQLIGTLDQCSPTTRLWNTDLKMIDILSLFYLEETNTHLGHMSANEAMWLWGYVFSCFCLSMGILFYMKPVCCAKNAMNLDDFSTCHNLLHLTSKTIYSHDYLSYLS